VAPAADQKDPLKNMQRLFLSGTGAFSLPQGRNGSDSKEAYFMVDNNRA